MRLVVLLRSNVLNLIQVATSCWAEQGRANELTLQRDNPREASNIRTFQHIDAPSATSISLSIDNRSTTELPQHP